MWKNAAGQQVSLFAFDVTTGQPKTGDAANMVFYVNKDWAGPVAIASNAGVPTEIDNAKAKGKYRIALAQAESNADVLEFTGTSSTGTVSVVPMRFDCLPLPGFRKNTAKLNFSFPVIDSVTKNRKTGQAASISATRRIDAGAFGAGTLGPVTEIGATGIYTFDWAAADLNGDLILLLITCVGCDDILLEIPITS